MGLGIVNKESAMPRNWFFTRDRREMMGPYTPKELKRLAATGKLLPTDRVKKSGMERMVIARRVRGLFVPPAGQVDAGTP